MEETQEIIESGEEWAAEMTARLESVQRAVERMLTAGLTRRTLALLIRDAARGPVTLTDVLCVIDGMEHLHKHLAEFSETAGEETS